MSHEKVQIEARVQSYKPNAMQEDFEDGFANYDATGLEILSPLELRGRQLTVFHDSPAPAGSLWRRPGARLRALIQSSSLTGGETVFAGALSNLQEVPAEG